MTKRAWLSGVMAAGLLMGACNDDSGDSVRAPTQAEIEGKWYLRRALAQGIVESLVKRPYVEFRRYDPIDQDSVFMGVDYYMRFGADSAFEMFQPNLNFSARIIYSGATVPVDTPSRQEGRYRLDGRSLITVSGDDTLEWTVTMEGTTLVLESAIDTVVRFPWGTYSVELDERGTLKGMYQK